MEIDLHGYHPAEIVFNGVLSKILQQTWEMGGELLDVDSRPWSKSRHHTRICEHQHRLFWALHSAGVA